jgi:hypothetical protein
LRYHQFFAPKIVERITKSAPPGADLKSWRAARGYGSPVRRWA